MKENSRRRFLKGTIGTLGGTILAQVTGLFPEARPLLARSTQEAAPVIRPPAQLDAGELYEGFLLLQSGDNVPDFVLPATLAPPAICGIGAEETGRRSEAVNIEFDSDQLLARYIDFPIYKLSQIPEGMRLMGASLELHSSGVPYRASLLYDLPDSLFSGSIINIDAYTSFAYPFPLFGSPPVEDNGPAITLDKVSFLPQAGIYVPLSRGAVFHWIKHNIRYMMTIEYPPIEGTTNSILSDNAMLNLASTLVQVS
jgi:hypothetical protein